MRTILSLFLLAALLMACETKEISPEISVIDLYINNNETNYSDYQMDMPILELGDEVSITLNLNGNGAELKTFLLVNDASDVELEKLNFNSNEVTSEFELTDESTGRLRFVDGVSFTTLEVKAKVVSVIDEMTNLCFYLSSKSETEGAQCTLSLKTKTD